MGRRRPAPSGNTSAEPLATPAARRRGAHRATAASVASAASDRPEDPAPPPLLDLGSSSLEEGVLLRRPSARNRSPYVGDVEILSGPNRGTVAITHLPNLDAGGKCRPGARLLCRRQPGVGPDTLGPHGTPKCELVCQLIRCEEAEHRSDFQIARLGVRGGGVWLSAHPSLNEKLVEALLLRGAFDDRLAEPVHPSRAPRSTDRGAAAIEPGSASAAASASASASVQTQVTARRRVTQSASGGYRPDFRLDHADGSQTFIETKQVVDTDYDPRHAAEAAANQPGHPVYAPGGAYSADDAETAEGSSRRDDPNAQHQHNNVYRRAGVFPWGKRSQKGPDGEAVVSARAIEHLRELAALARGGGGSRSSSAPRTRAVVALVAGRHDVASVRPNGAACASFARYLAEARDAGVLVVAHRVRWGEGADLGKAFDAGRLEIEASLRPGDEVLVAKRAQEVPAARGKAPAPATPKPANAKRRTSDPPEDEGRKPATRKRRR